MTRVQLVFKKIKINNGELQAMDNLSFITFYDLCSLRINNQHSAIMSLYSGRLVVEKPFSKDELLPHLDVVCSGTENFVM